MTGITEFTEARLAEREALAKEAMEDEAAPWRFDGFDLCNAKGTEIFRPGGYESVCFVDSAAAHIAANDPARVLRETAVLRTFLGDHQPTRPWGDYGLTYPEAAGYCADCGPGDNWQVRGEPENWEYARWPCTRIRELTSIWSDNPGYDQAWAPVPEGTA